MLCILRFCLLIGVYEKYFTVVSRSIHVCIFIFYFEALNSEFMVCEITSTFKRVFGCEHVEKTVPEVGCDVLIKSVMFLYQ